MDDIRKSLSKISEDITEIKVTSAIQTEQLKEHMRRTALLEAKMESIDAELEPITNTYGFLKKAGQVILGSGIITVLFELLLRMVKWLR